FAGIPRSAAGPAGVTTRRCGRDRRARAPACRRAPPVAPHGAVLRGRVPARQRAHAGGGPKAGGMTPRLLITVDTELSNFPNAQGLWGRVGDEDWGLRRMLDAFEALGIQATFFLDVYAGNDKDLAEQRRAAELIASRGQDLQLHTHPGPAFDRARPRLRDYSFAEQCDIIEFGCQRMQQWTGSRPVLHRAGDWGANHDSLRALRQCGMRADFSASVWSSDCGIDPSAMALNGWTRIDGLLCGVGTCY